MGEQNGTRNTTLKQPAYDEEDVRFWKESKEYWESQGQPWRRMPEINEERQKFLAERRSITPIKEQDIYPFKDIKLNRADIEWLLATLENGRGPIDWSDDSQRKREGLDLHGADLHDEDLAKLPLAKCNLFEANLEETNFFGAQLMEAVLIFAQLQRANFDTAQLQRANLFMAKLTEAKLSEAQLHRANLTGAKLERADIYKAQLQGACLSGANLKRADLSKAQLEGANLCDAQLEGTSLRGAQLKGAKLCGAQLGRTDLSKAEPKGADFEDVVLANAHHVGPRLADIQWGDTNLTILDWSRVTKLNDEYEAQQKIGGDEEKKDKHVRLEEYKTAVRAYRQLSIALRNQGLNEDAARFTYRAQLMQRKVFWIDRSYAKWLGSLFLDLLSGYGYKPLRCFIAYLIVILSFAIAYFIIGHKVGPHLSPLGSVVFSMTSFHGRGFFPGGIALDDPLTVIAALEAFIGLLIEVTFIATLTQRLFGK